MISISEAFEDQVQFTLNKVLFEFLEPSSENDPGIQVVTKDYINILTKNREFMNIVLGRDISFEPSGLFLINVSFEITWKTKDKEAVQSATNEEIIQAMLKEKTAFLSNMYSRISLLISQITSTIGVPPLITPGEMIMK